MESLDVGFLLHILNVLVILVSFIALVGSAVSVGLVFLMFQWDEPTSVFQRNPSLIISLDLNYF